MIKLKSILSEILLESELTTYGDLKQLIKMIKLKQKGGTIVSKGVEVGVDTLLGFLPGANSAKTFYDFFKAATKKPDTKKTKTWLDNLDIDDQVSAIVDDTVENGFLQDLAASIESESDTKELEPDFNMNKKLQDYLADKYDKRTVTMK
jgi:hypothetical protein